MSDWNGFPNLDLSDTQLDTFSALSIGEHEVKCTDVEITNLHGGGRRLILTLNATDGAGSIKAGLNIVHSSQKAQDIARSQLKTFLTAAGHPNPDRPGDLDTLKGLVCRVYVGEGKPYTNDKGETKQYNEVKRFILPEEMAGVGGGAPAGGTSKKFNDEIPF